MNPQTMTAPQTLDPLAFPLHGSRLIEASAGTGKTFTIAALYVRLVLGHGGEAAFARPLTPPEILVVTFTEAATKELRDRIRARLAEAAGCFRADPFGVGQQEPGKDFLHDLRAGYPVEQWPGCARKLQLAAEWMDEAAVSTIHGWCKRMLNEHAFDSDSLFTQQLETDQRELLAEVVRDFWRSFFVPLDERAVAEIAGWWATPDALQGELGKLVEHAAELDDAPQPADAMAAAREEKARALAALKAPWTVWVDELQGLLDAAVAAKKVNGQKLKKGNYDRWFDGLRAWIEDPTLVTPELKTGWTRFTRAGLAEVWKDGDPPDHPALDAMLTLKAELESLPDARSDLLRFAARWVAGRFAAEQQRRAQMGFNDLLTRLAAALRQPNGERLAEVIRRQFPVALIDEFQDTDPVQYDIFDRVYRIADNAPDAGVVLIGDPKQAIYAFRGADIFTYLRARRDAGGRLFTLGTNYRSTDAMVAAVNRCFAQAEAREDGEGAFLFRAQDDNPVPFHAVAAKGRREHLVADGAPVTALTCWALAPREAGKAVGVMDYRARMAASCAAEIVRLLNLGQLGRAGFARPGSAGDGEAFAALRPADIAILVNSRKEADAVRAELAAGGVRSVYLSDQESVFASPQAEELQRWLAACAEPDDAGLLRAALATPSLGLDWSALDRLRRDELEWEGRVLQFRAYRQLWRRQGVLPMLRRLLGDFGVPRRLLGGAVADGERALTDLLHLAELLQHASVALDGEHALIRHLAEQRADAGNGDDARKLRLESDADLVQVVTVHKSKGLEYPLVFLPFACTFFETTAKSLPLKLHDAAGRLRLVLEPEGDDVPHADRERLGEDLRKLYVALTRARHATWIGVAPVDKLELGALGYLLAGGAPIAADALPDALDALRGSCKDIAIEPAPAPAGERFVPQVARSAVGAAREPRRPVREFWWIASYSALRTAEADGAEAGAREFAAAGARSVAVPALAPQLPAAQTPAEETFAEILDEAPGALLAPGGDQRLHRFARGAGPGTFLHEILEWAAREGFGRVLAAPARARDMIARRCAVRGWSHWTETLTRWLLDFITTPLPLPGGAAPRLAELAGARPEMEFWFATHRADLVRLDALVRTHTLAAAPRPELAPGQLNGLLKGFIDLVFEHQGRYYVADYKSNWLGPDDAAYTPAAMRDAVLAKRYELQYVLYLFALHRLLKSRLPDYDYDRHVGGAVYLFLRGSHASTRGVHAERPPRALIEALDAEFGMAVAAGEGR
ncbi:exodeoxyribonuclease V subunit beta [Aromatoleum toluclasticum]|uniref:exodeoxyribonuclease V subunit beta n=1 Tax=Aromatoleum toluclasticum TaxID=92003 RepID=UPI001D186908|nr:exodeoxyribonuclease V subunit beta [Aromatoleum toluclasticum]MCC4114376.1 exodeoxyribonuclease V subunit beta [Aromatoleum toluclasticum]